MLSILLKLAQWTARNVLLLIPIILLILAIGTPIGVYIGAQYGAMTELNRQQEALEDTPTPQVNTSQLRSHLHENLTTASTNATEAVQKLERAGVARIDSEISKRRTQFTALKVRLTQVEHIEKSRQSLTPLALFPDPTKTISNYLQESVDIASEKAGLQILIGTLQQEISYLEKLRAIRDAQFDLAAKVDECKQIEQKYGGLWRAYEKAYKQHKEAVSLGSGGLPEERKAQATLDQLAGPTRQSARKYLACRKAVSTVTKLRDGLGDIGTFVLDRAPLDQATADAIEYATKGANEATDAIRGATNDVQDQLGKNFLYGVLNKHIKPYLVATFVIWALWLALPKIYRFVLYTVFARIASRQAPICLLPEASGTERRVRPSDRSRPNADAGSAVSLSVQLRPGEELLVLPQYLHDVPATCSTKAKLVLDRRHIGISVVAGLYDLTSVRALEGATIGLSAGTDGLSELEVLELPVGAATSLRAGHVVGLVRPIGSSFRITSKWELGKVQAWLTLQLRYVIFHGPVTLIIRGGRGVRVADAASGRTIPQRCTVGFSANLKYSTQRTETFRAYLTGKKPLLQDRFEGAPGVYVYEERPTVDKASGIGGRGVEAVLDAMLKLVGV